MFERVGEGGCFKRMEGGGRLKGRRKGEMFERVEEGGNV